MPQLQQNQEGLILWVKFQAIIKATATADAIGTATAQATATLAAEAKSAAAEARLEKIRAEERARNEGTPWQCLVGLGAFVTVAVSLFLLRGNIVRQVRRRIAAGGGGAPGGGAGIGTH